MPAGTITPGKMTYDLRRLRQHGLIERIPHTFRYQVTGTGIAHALFLTRLHDRFLRTGLAALACPEQRPPAGRRHPRLHQSHRRPRPASLPRRLTTARCQPTIPTCKHRT